MHGIGNDPFGQQSQGQGFGYGDRLVDRVMATEYNLAIQRNDAPSALGVLARMFGEWLRPGEDGT